MKKVLIIFAVLLFLWVPHILADDTTDYFIDQIYENIDLYELENQSQSPLQEFFETNSLQDIFKAIFSGENPFDFEHFFTVLAQEVQTNLRSTVNTIVTLLCLCIASALIQNLFSSFMHSEIETIASLAIYCTLIITLAKIFYESCAIAMSYVGLLCEFMNVLLPVIFIIIVLNGGFSTVSAISPVMLLCVSALGNLTSGIIIPILSFSFVIMMVGSIFTKIDISAFAKFLKSSCLYILGGVFIIVLSVVSTSAITFSGIDSAAMQTTKYALNSFIPVIGRFLSESAGTLIGLMSAFSSSVGFVGAFTLIALSVSPLIKLGVCALLFKITGALAQPIADTKFSSIIIKASEYISLIFWCCVVTLLTFLMLIGTCALVSKWLVGASGV